MIRATARRGPAKRRCTSTWSSSHPHARCSGRIPPVRVQHQHRIAPAPANATNMWSSVQCVGFTLQSSARLKPSRIGTPQGSPLGRQCSHVKSESRWERSIGMKKNMFQCGLASQTLRVLDRVVHTVPTPCFWLALRCHFIAQSKRVFSVLLRSRLKVARVLPFSPTASLTVQRRGSLSPDLRANLSSGQSKSSPSANLVPRVILTTWSEAVFTRTVDIVRRLRVSQDHSSKRSWEEGHICSTAWTLLLFIQHIRRFCRSLTELLGCWFKLVRSTHPCVTAWLT